MEVRLRIVNDRLPKVGSNVKLYKMIFVGKHCDLSLFKIVDHLTRRFLYLKLGFSRKWMDLLYDYSKDED